MAMIDNKEILYGYAVDVVLPTLRPGGFWVAPDPAPLTVEEIVETFKRISEHPSYDEHTIVTESKDGTVVVIKKGEIEQID